MTAPLYIVDARPLSWQATQIMDAAVRVAGSPPTLSVTFPPAPDVPTPTPRVLLVCGTESLRKLVPDAPSAQEARGYMWDTAWGRVVASMSPEDIVTDWTPWRALFDLDLRRALGELATGCPPFHVPDVTVVTNGTLGEACWRAMRAAEWCGADIENTHELELACMGFAESANHAYVIPAGEAWQRDLTRDLCEDPKVRKVFQNGQYDRLFLARQCGIETRGHAFDTQLAWHALNPELAGKKTEVGYKKAKSRRTAKSLKFLASIYCRAPWYKDYSFTSEHERYELCGKDCAYTLDIANKQAKQLESA